MQMHHQNVNIIKTACQASHCECGVLVHIKNDLVVKIEGDPDHPMNRGKICPKALSYTQLVYHPDRIRYPQKRVGERGGGKWQQISWNEALDLIAVNFNKIKDKYGPLALAASSGTQPRGSFTSTRRLAYALGTPNLTQPGHVCFGPSIIAEAVTFGSFITAEIGPDYSNAKCIVVWGANPIVSHLPRGLEILEAKKSGSKLIVIDPRRTKLASIADYWLQIRPGTDAALALGIINYLIQNKLYDEEFVNNWCLGFSELADSVKSYSLKRVSEITWIPEDFIKEVAVLYATNKPAALHHRVALEQNINSVQSCRLAAILIAITGNIDIKGGNLLPQYPKGFMTRMDLMAEAPVPRELAEKRIGAKEFPLFSGPDSFFQTAHAPLVIKAMVEENPYPIKGLFSTTNNFLMCYENTQYIYKAMMNLDYFVYVDFFMTPSAELADIVLPSATWLEKDEICVNSYQNYITARQKAIEPVGECWDDKKIAIEIARRISGDEYKKWFPWENVEGYNNYRLKKMGINFDTLKKDQYIFEPMKYLKYKNTSFKTASGKVELYSKLLDRYGYNAIPDYKEPFESPDNSSAFDKEYPLILITGGKDIVYFHTENRQIPRLRKTTPDPLLDIHPDTAKKLGISNADWVWIETPRVSGRVKQKANLTLDIDPRVIHAKHGWWFPEVTNPDHGVWTSNINVVMTNESPFDAIAGSSALRGSLCKIYPA